LRLEKIAQTLTEQLSAEELDRHLQDRQRLVERALTLIGGTAFTVFIGAIIWALIYKIIIVKGEILEGLLFLGLFVAAITSLLLEIYRESLRSSIAKQKSPQPKALAGDTHELLPETGFTPVNSVTERTTELLNVDRKSTEQH
jgi:hypothetical protein